MTKLLYIGQRSFDGVTAATNLPVNSILSADYSKIAEELVPAGAYSSLELETRHRKPWSNKTLNQLTNLRPDLIKESDHIIPYAAYGDNPVSKAAMINPDLKKILDDKIFMKAVFRMAGVPYPQEIARHEVGFAGIWKAVEGSSGSEVSRVKDDIHPKARYGEEFISGIPICINAIIDSKSIELFPPSVQVIGSPSLTNNEFGYCGNDFHHDILGSSQLKLLVRKYSIAVCETVRSFGYRGAMGLDFIWTPQSELFAIEINPRFQNSSQLLDFSAEKTNNYINMHFLSHRGREPSQVDFTASSSHTCGYSQFILHSDRSFTVGHCLHEGVYRFDGSSQIQFIRRNNLSHLGKFEICIVGLPLLLGMKVESGSVLAKVILPYSVLDRNASQLNSKVNALANHIKAYLVP